MIRACKVCKGWHDLEVPWPEACYSHFKAQGAASIQIIRDIQPYKAVAVDKRTGKAPVITSRSEHREFLRANQYVEIGNEPIRKPPEPEIQDSRPDIKRAIDQIKGEGRWR